MQSSGKIWDVHDDIVWSVTKGELPGNHESVRSLLSHAVEAAEALDRGELTVGRAAMSKYLLRPTRAGDLGLQVAKEYRFWQLNSVRDPEGLSLEEIVLFEKFHARLVGVVLSGVLLGSWPGIAVYVPMAVWEIWRGRSQLRQARAAAGADNGVVMSLPWFRIRLSKLVGDKLPAVVYGVAMLLAVPRELRKVQDKGFAGD